MCLIADNGNVVSSQSWPSLELDSVTSTMVRIHQTRGLKRNRTVIQCTPIEARAFCGSLQHQWTCWSVGAQTERLTQGQTGVSMTLKTDIFIITMI